MSLDHPDHWCKKARIKVGELNPGAMQEKATLKSLEAEIRRQVLACFMHIEKDLDMLHEQLHQDLYHAVSKEFVSVAQNLNAIRRESMESIEDLREAGGELEKQVVALDYSIQYLQKSDHETSSEPRGAANATLKVIESEVARLWESLEQDENSCFARLSKIENQIQYLQESERTHEASSERAGAANATFGVFESEVARLWESLAQDENSCFARLSKLETRCSEEFPALRRKSTELEDSFVAMAVQVKATQDLSSRINEVEALLKTQPARLGDEKLEHMSRVTETSDCVDNVRMEDLSSRIHQVEAELKTQSAKLDADCVERASRVAEASVCVDKDRMEDLCSRISQVETQLQTQAMALQAEAAERATRTGELAVSVEDCRMDHMEGLERHKQLEEVILKMTNDRASESSPAGGDVSHVTDKFNEIVERIEIEGLQRHKQLEEAILRLTNEKHSESLDGFQRHKQLEDAILQITNERISESCAPIVDIAQISAKFNELVKRVENDGLQRHNQLEEVIAKLAKKSPSESRADREDITQFADNFNELVERVESLGQDIDASRRDIKFSQACWMRNIDWTANVDLAVLESTGKFDVESPPFAAAGLHDIRLALRIRTEKSQLRRWTFGVFVKALEGQVSFRLHVGGKVQSFAADFVTIPEWGSQKMLTLDHVTPLIPIRFEVLDAVVSVPDFVAPDMVATFSLTDAARVAAREAEAVRTSMVKKIEWRVGRIPERIAAARAAATIAGSDAEALEPVISPAFSAGGIEDLQLHLYPLGYLRRDKSMPTSTFEEKCSFFLVCPKGTYVKCRAFVGDQVKIFEHHYLEREPFGRSNFCRLIDKRGDDDCVLCGIEILEVRQERFTQVKAGPFGNIVDQMKVTLAPGLGNMELMRELRDIGERGPRATKQQHNAHVPQAPLLSALAPSKHGLAQETILSPLGPSKRLANANSLPALLPVAPSSGHDVAAFASPSNRSKRIDAARK